MLIKAGVEISRLNREIRRSLSKVQAVLNNYQEELVITSTFDGSHGEGSLHYSNDAYDMRLPSHDVLIIVQEIIETLGVKYDVAHEGNHIHIEYDPKV